MTDPDGGRTSQCRVIELRRYRMRPGGRDVLIELFERELVETQEEHGMAVLGQFRDIDDPDQFVWMRGFPDMTARRIGLAGFYGGPVWARHRAAANATMDDSDDVLLLRPMSDRSGLPATGRRPPVGAPRPGSLVGVTIWSLPEAVDGATRSFFRDEVEPVLAVDGPAAALLETEPAENTYPALPVRTDAHVVVRVARFDDFRTYEVAQRRLSASDGWRGLAARLGERTTGPATTLMLDPTPRSLLR
jgi:hypothetical protein